MEEILKKIGVKLVQRREQLGLTQKDVASITGLSDTTIRYLEKGKPGVALGNLAKVADFLGLELLLLNKKMSNENNS